MKKRFITIQALILSIGLLLAPLEVLADDLMVQISEEEASEELLEEIPDAKSPEMSKEDSVDSESTETEEEELFTGFIPLDYDAPVAELVEPEMPGHSFPRLFSANQVSPLTSASTSKIEDEYYNACDDNIITSVKNQGSYEICWAFAGASAAETSMIKNGLADLNQVDYSEKHLAYYFYNYKDLDDELHNTSGDYTAWKPTASANNIYKIGGNQYLAAFALADWMGPAGQAEYPYMVNSEDYPEITQSDYFNSKAHLQNFYFIGYDTDDLDTSKRNVKQAILDYGSVVIGYYNNSAYRNGSAIYCNKKTSSNHGVTLVGWDDTYDRSNFRSGTQPSENGAWIMKNSWGDSSGDQGYYYISYEDKTIKNVAAFSYEPADNYDHQYFYDGSTGIHSINGRSSGDKFANVFETDFTTDHNFQLLRAVAVAFNTANVTYDVEIYKNPEGGKPDSGVLVSSRTGLTTTHAGFYTVELAEPVALRRGESFSVVINPSEASDKIFADTTDTSNSWVDFVTEEEAGQSYWYNDSSKKWNDLADGTRKYTARIRAYTTDEDIRVEVPSPYASLGNEESVLSGTKVLLSCQLSTATIRYSLKTGEEDTSEETYVYTGSPFTISGNPGDRVYLTIWAEKDGAVSPETVYKYTIKDEGTGDIASEDIAYWNSLSDADKRKIWVPDIADQTYTGKNITLDGLKVYFYNKLLTKGTDYTVSFACNKNVTTDKRKAVVTITGKGNYAGTVKKEFIIRPVELNKLDEAGLDISKTLTLAYAKGVQKPNPAVYYNELLLKKGTDYTIKYLLDGIEQSGIASDEKQALTYQIEYTGKGNFSGTFPGITTVTVKPRGDKVTSISTAKITFTEQGPYYYTGAALTPEFLVMCGTGTNGNELEEEKDYTVRWLNNVNKGTATLMLTGVGSYNGTLKRTFAIRGRDIGECTAEVAETSITYRMLSGGLQPEVSVRYSGKDLVRGTDYTVVYSQNKAAGKQIQCRITGKGNFAGYVNIESSTVKPAELSLQTLILSDMKYTDKKDQYKTKFSIIDQNGYVLKPGTDYENDCRYEYAAVLPGSGNEVGREVSNTIPRAGETIRIVVCGKGNYAGTIAGTYEIIDASGRLSFDKASVNITAQTYSGEPLMPSGDRADQGELLVKYGETILSGADDYVIAAYSNNINKGTAYIVLQGKGEYYGTKKVSFSIRARKN